MFYNGINIFSIKFIIISGDETFLPNFNGGVWRKLIRGSRGKRVAKKLGESRFSTAVNGRKPSSVRGKVFRDLLIIFEYNFYCEGALGSTFSLTLLITRTSFSP
jgi:hypothetical protein